MDGAQYKVEGTALEILAKLLQIVRQQAELHAPADFQPGQLQLIVLLAIDLGVEGHVGHLAQGIVVDVVGEADFFQTGGLSGLGHARPESWPSKDTLECIW